MREGLLGWATDSLVRLDDEAHGIIARVLTASPSRRQAIFAALAAQEVKGDLIGPDEDLPLPPFAEIVRHSRPADILRHAFGKVPEGFLGLLERVGDRPLPRPQDYIALRDLLVSGDLRAAHALRESGRITLRKLEVLASLAPRWRHANTLTRIDSPAEAVRFNSAIEFVQAVSSRATDEVVAAAIANMVATATLPRLLDRFVRRADLLPPHPVGSGDNELRPFLSMRDYLEASRRYRNCLASKLDQVAAGRLAISEYRGEVLLEFRPLTAGAGWMLWQVHGPRNSPVPLQVCEAAEAKCDHLGIPRVNDGAGGSRWRNFRSFSREMDWD